MRFNQTRLHWDFRWRLHAWVKGSDTIRQVAERIDREGIFMFSFVRHPFDRSEEGDEYYICYSSTKQVKLVSSLVSLKAGKEVHKFSSHLTLMHLAQTLSEINTTFGHLICQPPHNKEAKSV